MLYNITLDRDGCYHTITATTRDDPINALDIPWFPNKVNCLQLEQLRVTQFPASFPQYLYKLVMNNVSGITSLPNLPFSLNHCVLEHMDINIQVKLPPQLRTFTVTNCGGIHITNACIPYSLMSLGITNTPMERLPQLNEGLIVLKVVSAGLKTIDYEWPSTLCEIHLIHNQLRTIPPIPVKTTSLFLSNNQLKIVPIVHSRLFMLDISGNTKLKGTLDLRHCTSLNTLNCNGCRFRVWKLPTGLRVIHCQNTSIHHMNMFLDTQQLIHLDLKNSRVRIPVLPVNSPFVDLRGNPLVWKYKGEMFSTMRRDGMICVDNVEFFPPEILEHVEIVDCDKNGKCIYPEDGFNRTRDALYGRYMLQRQWNQVCVHELMLQYYGKSGEERKAQTKVMCIPELYLYIREYL
jgi:hypothetical protein